MPRRGRERAASETLGTFLMVAVTLVLVGVLFIMMVGGTGAPASETSTLVFSVGAQTPNATNQSRNDTLYTVTAKLGNGDIVWNDSTFHIYIADNFGSVLSQHNLTTTDVNGNGRVDSGDQVRILGWPPAYHGLRVTVVFHNRIVGDVAVP